MLMTLVSLVVSAALMQVFVNICNVGYNNVINHLPVITIDSWYKPFPNGWFVTLLYPHYTCRDLPWFFQHVGRLHWKFQAKERLGCRHCQMLSMASEASDKTKILNSLVLPRAGTRVLQEEAPTTHESNLFELWNSFLSDFFVFLLIS